MYILASDPETILTYEEVGLYRSDDTQKRPIILVGCEELRLQRICDQLMRMNPRRFSQPIKSKKLLCYR